MKTLRLPLLAALLFGSSVLTVPFARAAAPASKAQTYAVIGFFEGARPASALVDQAGREVSARMRGLSAVQNPEDADHVVQILFRRGSYKVYVDALPLNGVKLGNGIEQYYRDQELRFEMSRETAEGHGRNR